MLVSCRYYAHYTSGHTTVTAAIQAAINRNINEHEKSQIFKIVNYTKHWAALYRRTKKGAVNKIEDLTYIINN